MITRRSAALALAAALAGPSRLSVAQALPAAPSASGDEQPITWDARPTRLMLRANSPAETEIWAFNGTPGPVLRVGHGRPVRLRIGNETPVPLAFHFHGVRGPGPRSASAELTPDPIAPGGTGDYGFTPPDPGTYLIRPCIPGRSAEPAERGLTALLVVEEETAPPVDHDVPMLVDDWLLAEDGSLAPFNSPDGTPLGRLGNLLTVNGAPVPRALEFAPGSRVRLRLANACNARIMRLRLQGMNPSVIAIDGQPTERFEPLDAALPFAPGTRYDLLLQMPDTSGEHGRIVAAIGQGVPLVTLTTAGERPERPRNGGAGLPRNDRLPSAIPLEKAARKDLVLTGGLDGPWAVNGAPGDRTAAPALRVKRGSPVVLALANRTRFPQPLHLHGHVFRLLHALDDGWEPYFLDTILVPEERTVRIAFVADRPGRWLLASTILERFDAGLWTWIEVT
jgi:FtsP/CotA-like multicopper oxidase with cupredoxin domain